MEWVRVAVALVVLQVDPTFIYGNSGTLSGTGGLSLNGGGELVLSGSNIYSGGTNVEDGVLDVTNPPPCPMERA